MLTLCRQEFCHRIKYDLKDHGRSLKANLAKLYLAYLHGSAFKTDISNQR